MIYPYENLENFTLPALLNRSVELYGDKKVLSKVSQEPMTYTELYENVMTMIKILKVLQRYQLHMLKKDILN